MDAVFVATLLGSAVGVVAGTIVQYFTQIFIAARQARARRANLAKEFAHNLAVVARVKEDLARVRSRVGAGEAWSYQPILPFGDGLHLILDKMSVEGEIYDLFGFDDISKLQKVCRFLIHPQSEWVLRQYEDFKSRQDAGAYLAHLDYLDHLCGELRSSLENLLAKARRLPRG
jgi:hypothetical protein